jgi:hypothetical protein
MPAAGGFVVQARDLNGFEHCVKSRKARRGPIQLYYVASSGAASALCYSDGGSYADSAGCQLRAGQAAG